MAVAAEAAGQAVPDSSTVSSKYTTPGTLINREEELRAEQQQGDTPSREEISAFTAAAGAGASAGPSAAADASSSSSSSASRAATVGASGPVVGDGRWVFIS
jgi:hypothetical protein